MQGKTGGGSDDLRRLSSRWKDFSAYFFQIMGLETHERTFIVRVVKDSVQKFVSTLPVLQYEFYRLDTHLSRW